jgi:hypothetical protein
LPFLPPPFGRQRFKGFDNRRHKTDPLNKSASFTIFLSVGR